MNIWCMAGRGGTTPTKNSLNTPVPPPAKHEKTPQLLPLQTKIFQVPPFAIFLHFFSVPLVGGGAGGPCHVMHLFKFCWLWIFPWVKLSWHSCSMWDKLRWLNPNPKGFYYSCMILQFVWRKNFLLHRTYL